MRLTLWLTRKVNQEVNQDFMKASVSVICYKHKVLANGESPLMLRIAKDGKRTMKSLGISVNPSYWDFGRNQPKNNCPNRNLIAITKRYLGLRQEEILQTYDCLTF